MVRSSSMASRMLPYLHRARPRRRARHDRHCRGNRAGGHVALLAGGGARVEVAGDRIDLRHGQFAGCEGHHVGKRPAGIRFVPKIAPVIVQLRAPATRFSPDSDAFDRRSVHGSPWQAAQFAAYRPSPPLLAWIVTRWSPPH